MQRSALREKFDTSLTVLVPAFEVSGINLAIRQGFCVVAIGFALFPVADELGTGSYREDSWSMRFASFHIAEVRSATFKVDLFSLPGRNIDKGALFPARADSTSLLALGFHSARPLAEPVPFPESAKLLRHAKTVIDVIGTPSKSAMLVIISGQECLCPVVIMAGAARSLVNKALASFFVGCAVEWLSFVEEPVSADMLVGPVGNLMRLALIHVNKLSLIAF